MHNDLCTTLKTPQTSIATPIHSTGNSHKYAAPVIADLIRNPEGQGALTTNPLSLDGRGIKGEGDPVLDAEIRG